MQTAMMAASLGAAGDSAYMQQSLTEIPWYITQSCIFFLLGDGTVGYPSLPFILS